MFDFNVTQLVAIGIALASFVYMFKDNLLSLLPKSKSSNIPDQDDVKAIKDLLDFRTKYSKGNLVYSKLTEVIGVLLNKDE